MVVVADITTSKNASEVIKEARKLADCFDEELHIINVMTQAEFLDVEQSSIDETGRPVEMDEVREAASEIAAQTATEAGVESFQPIGKVGDPSKMILDYADTVDAEYIVIGGRRRSPTGKAVFGDKTQSILLKATRPVVVIMTGDE